MTSTGTTSTGADASVSLDTHPDTIDHLKSAFARFAGLFSLQSSSGANLGYLNGLRGLAVILVIVFHFWLKAGSPHVLLTLPLTTTRLDFAPLIASGFVGVNLFFVLSGFLLSQEFLRADFLGGPRPSLRRFFRHRFFRIVPAYFCCLFLIIALLCPGFIRPDLVYSRIGALDVALHALFLQNLLPTTIGQYNRALWTLTLEVIFYLTLPWAIYLFVRDRWAIGFLASVGLAFGWMYLSIHAPAAFIRPIEQIYLTVFPQDKYPKTISEPIIRLILENQLPSYYFQFCFGIVVANLHLRKHLGLPQSRAFRALTNHWAGKCYFLLGAVIALISMQRLGGFFLEGIPIAYPPFAELATTIGFTLILAGLLWGGHRLQVTGGFGPLRFAGIISYSAYLWHIPILSVTLGLPIVAAATTPAQKFPPILWHASIVVLFVSMFSYLAIEKPFIMIGRGRREAKLAPVPVSARFPIGAAPGAVVMAQAGEGPTTHMRVESPEPTAVSARGE